LHKHFIHPSVEKLYSLLQQARPHETDFNTKNILKSIQRHCDTCQANGFKPQSFKISSSIPESDDLIFNRQIDIDLLWLNSRPALHVVDHDTNFSAAKFLNGESTEHVWQALLESWILIYNGIPHAILADQGSVFTSRKWKELCTSSGISLKLTAIENHNANGLCESKHGTLRKTFNKLKYDFPDCSDELALLYAIKARNDTSNAKGIVPSTLLFGTMPRILEDEPAGNLKRYQLMALARHEHAKHSLNAKIDTALRSRPAPASDFILVPGQTVYVWREKQGWKGPYLLHSVKDKICHVFDQAGAPRPFNISQIKPYHDPVQTYFSDLHSSLQGFATNSYDNLITPNIIHITEILDTNDPRSHSIRMQEAKSKELIGLLERGTFKIILRSDLPPHPNLLTTRFVLAIKNSDTENEIYKARLVVRGFQDRMKGFLVHEPNTVRVTSIRILMAIASLLGFSIWSEDVTQAFVQSTENLLRDIYLEPAKELQMDQDLVLKLIKPLYGLSDSGDHWARTLNEHHKRDLGMTQSGIDGSLFFKQLGSNLIGLSATYVDDTLRAGTPRFVKDAELTGQIFDSKLPTKHQIKFAGLDITSNTSESNAISQQKYIERINALPDNAEFDEYRSLRARLAWVTQTRPDISCNVAFAAQVTKDIFNTNPSNYIKDLNQIIKYLQRTKDIYLKYPKLDINGLALHVFSDASFARNDDFTCQLGYVAFLADENSNCCPLEFKSLKAKRVTRSILGGELIAFAESFDRGFALRDDLQAMLGTIIPLKMYTDSKCLFDVITKGSMTAERRLQIDIALAREGFNKGWISDMALIPSEENLADGMTKKDRSSKLLEVLRTGKLDIKISQWIIR
jgi:hypothetical protein